MKKLIFGIALMFFGLFSLPVSPALCVASVVAGLCLAIWDVFLADPLRRWWNAPVELNIYVNGKRVKGVKLPCLRRDKREEVYARALELDEVRQALDGRRVTERFYERGTSLDLHVAEKPKE